MSATPHPDVGGMIPRRLRRIVVVSDLHCGSTVGLLAPGLQLSEDRRPGLSAIQQWMWKCWLDFTEWALADPEPFALVINGDAVEGVHHGTVEIVSPVPSDHVAIAEACLSPIAERAERVFVIRGTEAHTGTMLEAGLAVMLGGERNRDTGMTAWDELNVRVCDTLVRFVHHMPTTTRKALKASQLGIQLNEHRTRAFDARHPIPDIVIAGHRHEFGFYDEGEAMMMALAPWQGLTRFGKKVVGPARVWVGGVSLRWHTDGQLPTYEKRLYVADPATEVVI